MQESPPHKRFFLGCSSLHYATRRNISRCFALGASDVCLVVKTRHAPSRHCRDARGHTTTAMHDNEYTPPARARQMGGNRGRSRLEPDIHRRLQGRNRGSSTMGSGRPLRAALASSRRRPRHGTPSTPSKPSKPTIPLEKCASKRTSGRG